MKFDIKDIKKVNALTIRLHGHEIGIIHRLGGDQHIFAFQEDYIHDAARPTLSLSFKGQTGGLVTSTRAVRRRLPAFFSNLLPEGNMRAYLAARAGVKPEREFFLLAVLGADLPGALTVTPQGEEQEAALTYHAAVTHDRRFASVLRFSLAGVQLKFSAIIETSGGLMIPADGMGGSWVLKLPSARFPAVPENEFVMLELARTAGLSVPSSRLIDTKEVQGLPKDAGMVADKALAVRRFDRGTNGQRIHMEDFAQVFGLFPETKYGRRSYSNIASVLWAETGEVGTYEFVRRLVFSVLIGNADMHLKNWSLLYPDHRTPALSPAYDLVATLPYIPNDKLALSFGGSRSLSEVTFDQVRRFADTARLPVSPLWQIVVETADRTTAAWKGLDCKDLLPKQMKAAIGKQILKVAANIR